MLKRHKRANKYDPIVDKVDLIHATPNYAVVRTSGGRETTVSLRDIVSYNSYEAQPESDVGRINDTVSNDAEDMQNRCTETVGDNEINNSGFEPSEGILQSESADGGSQPVALRRSSCIRKAVDRYGAVPYVNLSVYLHI